MPRRRRHWRAGGLFLRDPDYFFWGETMIKAELESIVGSGAVLEGQLLARYTSFQVGGPAEFLVRPETFTQAAGIIAYCRENRLPLHVMGRGTNLLVSDRGLSGVVMVLGDNLAAIRATGPRIVAQAGASLARVSALALANNLSGLEFASGIPGSVGGAVVMNAGAFDGEMQDVLRQVLAANPRGELVSFGPQEMELGYRSSAFQNNDHLVLEAELELGPGSAGAIQAKMNDFNRRRRDKQPLDLPSAGSTFKRPPGHYAGQLIESCGLRGAKLGGAAVSEKHCGFIVNTGGATAGDVHALIRRVQAQVEKEQGVRLVPEVRFWGDFENES